MKAAVAIVGAAESERLGRQPDLSAIELAAQSVRGALADCGLSIGDVDGLASAELSTVDLADYLGVRPAWIDTTSVGGCSYMAHVRHAAAAISAGLARTVVIAHGESGRSKVGQPPWRQTPGGIVEQFEQPFGTLGPVSTFTIPLLRYMKRYGLTHEQLAGVAVAQRKWAHLNSRAERQDLITVDDVLASRMIAYPFHQLECCLVSDGGGALVVVGAERAVDFPTSPVYVLGTGEGYEAPTVAQMEDFTSSRAFVASSQAAFAQAGLGPKDIDHVMIYDAFAHLPLYGLEDLGFVARGDAGAFIEEGHTEPGGTLPLNTNGGGLSYTHTGMYGMFAIQESVRQLRHQAAAQVEGVETSFVQGVGGGTFTAASSLVLSGHLG
jgi:acetyl-CoA acetyltransferase